ncbi:MAG TPA: beta-ketoacyl-ACP synthase III [Oligoflexia bacterium]|nr:beta-ketoacyl-ACP synthase III [Oligoflexia bacterium]HMP47038.1 beta-ketoacyl-ACP synthase III [Oligoflexia bacterium]
MNIGSRIIGTGMNVPENIVPNRYFETYLDTTSGWIEERSGIIERRWADETLSASSLAVPACERAIFRAGLKPIDIDAIVCATVTPDNIFPSTACAIQRKLACPEGLAFDVNAVCSGFLYALGVSHGLISSGQCRKVLVVGTELYSRIIDKNDRTTAILFGDGAGAVVLESFDKESSKGEEVVSGIITNTLGADGNYEDILCVPSGTAHQPTPDSLREGRHYLTMAGREVFKLAVRRLSEINRSVVSVSGYSLSDIKWFVSHQANKRILQSVAKDIGVSEDRFPMNISKYGNTSAASVPILLAEMDESGMLSPGDLVVLSAFGGGVTWGATLLRW